MIIDGLSAYLRSALRPHLGLAVAPLSEYGRHASDPTTERSDPMEVT